jgi:hypothetical protein
MRVRPRQVEGRQQNRRVEIVILPKAKKEVKNDLKQKE